MKFVSPAQREAYLKVLPWMEELFGEFLIINEQAPEFGIMVGSAFAQTTLHPYQEDVLVCTRAYVVRGATLSYELYDFLLRENCKVLFGGFGVDPQGDIFFQHSILGSTCDPPELQSSVTAVAVLADQYDDKIVNLWGGVRARDQLQ